MPPVIDTTIPPLVNTASAAAILGVSRVWVQTLYSTGRLPCRPLGDNTNNDGKRRHRHVVFRLALIQRYAKNGIPKFETGDEPRIDEKIPALLRPADMAALLDTSTATVNQLWRTGKLSGRAVPGANGDTDVVVFRPEEGERAAAQRETVVSTRWAPAKP